MPTTPRARPRNAQTDRCDLAATARWTATGMSRRSGTHGAIAPAVEMRALPCTVAFLLASQSFCGPAQAHVASWGLRLSLSLAREKQTPRLTVTAAAPARTRLDVAAYGRAEGWLRRVASPHYLEPDVDRRQMFRQVSFSPYALSIGTWGGLLTVETNALLR